MAQCDNGWVASDLLQSVLSVNVSFISGRSREVSGHGFDIRVQFIPFLPIRSLHAYWAGLVG